MALHSPLLPARMAAITCNNTHCKSHSRPLDITDQELARIEREREADCLTVTMRIYIWSAIPSALGFATTAVPSSSRRFSAHRVVARHRRPGHTPDAATTARRRRRPASTNTRLYNLYDDWAGDLISSSQSEFTYDDLIMPLDEGSIEQCLEELMDSAYGETMFGRHDVPASVG